MVIWFATDCSYSRIVNRQKEINVDNHEKEIS